MEKKYLIFSDVHGKFGNLEWVLKNEDPFYGAVFCGDGEGLCDVLRNMTGCPPEIHMVSGNCDWVTGLPEEAVFRIGRHQAFLTHGNRFAVRRGCDIISRAAQEKGCDLCFFGHTHVPLLKICGEVLCVNPGSLSEPRGDVALPSYVIAEVAEDGEIRFTIKYVTG